MRYLFNLPTIWVWEMNALLLCVIVALGGGYALLVRGHVRTDLLYSRFSPRTKAIMDIVTSCFMFVFLGALLWQGIEQGLLSLVRLEHSHSLFRPPIYPFKIILAVGIFLFILQGLADLVRNIYIAYTGRWVSSGT